MQSFEVLIFVVILRKKNNILGYEIPHIPGILYDSVENKVFATEKKIRSVDFEENYGVNPSLELLDGIKTNFKVYI